MEGREREIDYEKKGEEGRNEQEKRRKRRKLV